MIISKDNRAASSEKQAGGNVKGKPEHREFTRENVIAAAKGHIVHSFLTGGGVESNLGRSGGREEGGQRKIGGGGLKLQKNRNQRRPKVCLNRLLWFSFFLPEIFVIYHFQLSQF